MYNPKTVFLFVFFMIGSSISKAQDSTKVFVSSGMGLLFPNGDFAKAYSISLNLGTGVEIVFPKKYFLDLNAGFNAVKYSQQIRETGSPFLFEKTNSNLIMLGANYGKIFEIGNAKMFMISPYVGLGYVNIGEPRLEVNQSLLTIVQRMQRMQGIFVKGGLRVGYKLHKKALEGIFLNTSYWRGNLKIQESRPEALSILIQTRVKF
jgi:hypothetical protein